ncbi:MAG: hypothetical protein AAB436_02215 [Patescibacteria group bacterium]
MAEKPKSTGKPIADVAHPNKSAPAQNSKSVIVTNRPMLKDPMVVDEDTDAQKPELEAATEGLDKSPTPTLDEKPDAPQAEPEAPSKNTITEIAAIAAADKSDAEDKADKDSKEDAPNPDDKKPEADKTEPANDEKSPDTKPTEDKDTLPENQLQIEDSKAAEHEAAVQKLSDSKKYYLPINAVEKRRSKQFVVLGIVLSIVLTLAWVDIALDASLIKIPGIKPVTHLFSN